MKNIGAAAADPSTAALKVGGETTPMTFDVPLLAREADHTVTRKMFLARTQGLSITATADYKGDVTESNEGNNKMTKTY